MLMNVPSSFVNDWLENHSGWTKCKLSPWSGGGTPPDSDSHWSVDNESGNELG